MPDWTAGEDRYMAEYLGESRDDAPDRFAPDHGQYPVCEMCEAAIADRLVAGQGLCPACARDVEAPAPSSEALAQAFSHRVFVDGEISLARFMESLSDYGDARVREARRALALDLWERGTGRKA